MIPLKFGPYKDINLDKKKYLELKEYVIKKEKSKCCFCGLSFNKFLYLVPRVKTKPVTYHNSTLSCRICYQIYNFSSLYLNNYLVCYSEMDQGKIVEKTMTYINKDQKVPSIKLIDSEAKKVNISILEYFDLVRDFDVLPKQLENIKIFVDFNMDLKFLGIKKEVFGFGVELDDSHEFDEFKKEVQADYGLKLMKFNKETNIFLNKHFGYSESIITNTIEDLQKTSETIINRLNKLKQEHKTTL